MDKLDKVLKGIRLGAGIAKPFVPGAVGSVLDVVTKELEGRGPTNAEPAVIALAKVNDQQTAAIMALHERVKKLEGK